MYKNKNGFSNFLVANFAFVLFKLSLASLSIEAGNPFPQFARMKALKLPRLISSPISNLIQFQCCQDGSSLPGCLPALASSLPSAAPHLGLKPMAIHLLPPHIRGFCCFSFKSFTRFLISFNLAPCSFLQYTVWWVSNLK